MSIPRTSARIQPVRAKFLIDKNGKVVRRFAPGTKPEKLSRTIEKLL